MDNLDCIMLIICIFFFTITNHESGCIISSMSLTEEFEENLSSDLFLCKFKNLIVPSSDCKRHNFHLLHTLSLPFPFFPVLSPIYWEIYLIKSLKNKGWDSAYLAYCYAKWEKYKKVYSNFTSFLWGPHRQKKKSAR